jgi:hypothetical protein
MDPATSQILTLKTTSLDYAPMALDGGTVYTLTGSSSPYSLVAIPASGGTETTIAASSVTPTNVAGSRRMIVADGYVYWAEPGSIWRIPVSGGTAQRLANGLGSSINTLVRDGAYLYFIDAGSIKRFAVVDPSTTLQTIVTSDSVIDFALDATALYWVRSVTTPDIRKMARP